MKRIRNRINSLKLRYKLALFYAAFCFLPVMILFLFSFVQMRRIIADKEILNLESYLYQSVATMDSKLEVYDNLSDYIAFDQNLEDVFSTTYEHPGGNRSGAAIPEIFSQRNQDDYDLYGQRNRETRHDGGDDFRDRE